MIVDYHIHTEDSVDGTGKMEDCIKEAKKKDIAEIGFSEHIILHHIKYYQCLIPREMQDYVQKFSKRKEEADIQTKLGAEIDFFPEDTEEIREFIQRYPFDYVIGGVHFIGNWCIDLPEQMHEYRKRDILQVYEDYFKLVRTLAHSQLFDILAHPDLIKMFGFRPKIDITSILEETAQALAKSSICIEVNTNGLAKPCAEIYPSEQFLKILHAHGVAVTLGSDAHKPENVGKNLDKAIKLLKKVGYTNICTFNHRKRGEIKLPF